MGRYLVHGLFWLVYIFFLLKQSSIFTAVCRSKASKDSRVHTDHLNS